MEFEIDLLMALSGLFVGFVVGLTGMGGGALMTPILVLFFNVPALAAVSSDLVVSLLMKPVGGAVHARRGTVNKRLVGWLCLGSVPAAFAGVLVLRALGDGERVEETLKLLLGATLLLASATMVVKAFVSMRQHALELRGGRRTTSPAAVHVRPIPTVLIGIVGGLVVGMTSVGSGSLIIVLLLLLYPTLKASELVGTDLVQAVPLVGAAALGHMLFGDVQLGLTASLLLGGIPGVYIGARVSSSAPQALIRRALVIVLVASGLKLVGLPTPLTGIVILVLAIVGPAAWLLARRAVGLPMRWRDEVCMAAEPGSAAGADSGAAATVAPGEPLERAADPSSVRG